VSQNVADPLFVNVCPEYCVGSLLFAVIDVLITLEYPDPGVQLTFTVDVVDAHDASFTNGQSAQAYD